MIETDELELYGYIDYHREMVYPELQRKIVEPKTIKQIVKPDEGFYGLSEVEIEPYEEGYQLNIENNTLVFLKGANVKGSELVL